VILVKKNDYTKMNNKQKIILLKGLPASGKSTWAKEFCFRNPTYIRINKDDIRDLLGSPVFNNKFEDAVLDIQRKMGITILDTGKSIVIDDTNFAKKHYTFWSQIASARGIIIDVINLDVPVEECIERDSKRVKPVGKAAILNMYQKYILNNE